MLSRLIGVTLAVQINPATYLFDSLLPTSEPHRISSVSVQHGNGVVDVLGIVHDLYISAMYHLILISFCHSSVRVPYKVFLCDLSSSLIYASDSQPSPIMPVPCRPNAYWCIPCLTP